MRYASLMRNVGLLMALGVALLVGCKKEKEQNGPSLTVGQGTVGAEETRPLGSGTLKFILIAQKGSGKDDADLKEWTFKADIGGAVNTITRPASGSSSTFDTTISYEVLAPQVRTYTFTVTDKNGKSVSRSFKITFQDTTGGGPTLYVDSLVNQNYTNQSDNKGTHLRYQVGTGSLTLQNRPQADNNPSEILFVYWYSSANGHSVISPGILKEPGYNNTGPEWDNPSTLVTNFKVAPSGVNFATAGHADIINAYNNGTAINNEFTGNADQRAECRVDRVLAFKQGNVYGLIRVDNATSGTPGATLSVKIARP